MTLTVETGAGLSNANSYVSLSDADTYHSTYNADSDWAGTDNATKESALIKATRSLDVLYGLKYASIVGSNTQNLLWPRNAFYDRNNRLVNSNEIPQSLQDAVCETALLSIQGYNIMPGRNEKDNIEDESVTIGEIAVSTKYRGSGNQPAYDNFSTVEHLLAPIMACRKTLTISR